MLVDEAARKLPPREWTEKAWGREVIANALVSSPAFEKLLDGLQRAFERGGPREFVTKLSKYHVLEFITSKETPNTTTIDRAIRKWKEKHRPIFKHEASSMESRPSRTLCERA